MQNFNRWLRENATTTTPPMTVVDTTSMSIEAAVDAVAGWVRARLNAADITPPSGSSA
jgi:hypothetical protein